MITLEQLIERTMFLHEKQLEAKQDCHKIFSDLIKTIEEKLATSKQDTEEREALEKIHDLVAGQAQKISDDAQEDVDFLDEQLKALLQIKAIKDPEKAQTILATLLENFEEDEETDTEAFKKQITEEASISKQNLLIATHDIKEAIKEGSSAEVQVMLEAMLAQDEEVDEDGCDEDCDDDCSDEHEDGDCGDCSGCSDGQGCGSESLDEHAGEKKSGCGSGGGCGSGACGSGGCGSGGCGKGCGSDGIDIFEQIAKLEKDLKK